MPLSVRVRRWSPGAYSPAGVLDAFIGRGMGAVDFSWSALVAELVEPDPAASSSYICAESP